MIVNIIENSNINETKINIECKKTDEEIIKLISLIKNMDNNEKIIGINNGETYCLNPNDILYFEAVDRKTFCYTEEGIFIMTCVVSIYVIKFKWVETTVTGILIRFFIAFSIGIITNTCIEKFLTKEGEKYTKILNEYKNRNKKIDN